MQIQENKLLGIIDIIRREYAFNTVDKVLLLSLIIYLKREYDTDGYINIGFHWKDVEKMLSEDEVEPDVVTKTLKLIVEELLLTFDDPDRPFFIKHKNDFLKGLSVSNARTFVQVLHYMQSVDISRNSISVTEFSKMYIEFLTNLFKLSRHGQFSFSKTVIDLIVNISLTFEFSSVCDPCCGTGSLLTNLINSFSSKDKNNDILFYAKDLLPALSFITLFNLSFAGRATNSFVATGNSLINPEKIKGGFDLIVSEIPFGSKLTSEESTFIRHTGKDPVIKTRKEIHFIDMIISSLSSKGKAVVVVPNGVLFRGKKFLYMKKLISEDIIETVVQLPVGAYSPYTGIKTSLIIFNKRKDKKQKKNIQFIDASKLLSSKEDGFEVDKVVKLFLEKENKKHFSTVVSNDKIAKNEYDLSPELYTGISVEVDKSFENKRFSYLENLADIVYGRSAINDRSMGRKTRVLKVKDLKRDIFDVYADNKNIGLFPVRKDRARVLNSSCLLIARVGLDLKPTLFNPDMGEDNIKIIQDRNVLAIFPRKGVLLEYLYYLFYDPIITSQLDIIRTSSTYLPSIKIDLIKRIKLPMATIEKQKEYISNEKLRLIEIEKARTEEKIKSISATEAILETESGIISTLAHNILPIITNVIGDTNRLNEFLDVKGLKDDLVFDGGDLGVALDEDFDISMEVDSIPDDRVEDLLKRLQENLQLMEKTIAGVKEVVEAKIERRQFALVPLKDLFSSVAGNFKYKGLKISVTGKNIKTYVHKEAFKTMVENIIRNALRHGFSDFNGMKKISFNIELDDEDDGTIKITYTNNGNRFKLTKDEFVLAGKKGAKSDGCGIGGFYIDKVIKGHLGEFTIDLDDPGMKMIITIPILEDNDG